MINTTLFKKEVKSNYKLLLIFAAILTMYITIIVSMFDPEKGDAMQQLIDSMPELMAAFGMSNSGSTLIDFMASYLYGFLVLIFPTIFTIILSTKLIVGYVDKGSMAYILATPTKRWQVALTQASVMWLSIGFLVAYITVAGIIAAQVMFPGELDIQKFILLNLVLYVLHFSISGISFFFSCIRNETRLALSFGAGIPILFYLILMLSNMGGKLEELKYFTIFTLFNPTDIIGGENVMVPIAILLLLGVILYSAGIYFFSKRDLPL